MTEQIMDNKEVIYFLNHPFEVHRRARRKSLSILLHPDSPLRVHANMSLSQNEILQFLQKKERWISKHLQNIQQIKAEFKTPQLKQGELYPFLGEKKYLQFTNSTLKKIFFKVEDGFLVGYLPQNTSIDDYEEALVYQELTKFYKAEAARLIPERVQHWIERTQLQPARISFRAPQKRWGSCNSRKHICLNWKLICQPAALIDYVIVHELCHLKHMNHSADFWSLVESFLPDYEELEKILQHQERLAHFLKT